MAKTKFAISAAPSARPPDWQSSSATYLAGLAHLDGADHLASEMETKWGVGRLRLLVSPDLRERFDRQRLKFNTAMRTGELADVQREATRMVTAWRTLDAAAEQAGANPLSPLVWEVGLEDGSVAAIVRDNADAHAVYGAKDALGRVVHVWTLDEVAQIIHGFPALAKAKTTWPGAEVVAVRRTITDPLEAIDDELPF